MSEASGHDLVDKIERLFNGLSRDTMDILADFYHQDVVFEDPLGRHEGLAAARRYYERLYKNVITIRFDFGASVVTDNRVASPWTMYLKSKGLNGGNEVVLPGISYFEFEESSGLIRYHRDYFDMGAFVYRYVPIVKSIVGFVNNKLKGD